MDRRALLASASSLVLSGCLGEMGGNGGGELVLTASADRVQLPNDDIEFVLENRTGASVTIAPNRVVLFKRVGESLHWITPGSSYYDLPSFVVGPRERYVWEMTIGAGETEDSRDDSRDVRGREQMAVRHLGPGRYVAALEPVTRPGQTVDLEAVPWSGFRAVGGDVSLSSTRVVSTDERDGTRIVRTEGPEGARIALERRPGPVGDEPVLLTEQVMQSVALRNLLAHAEGVDRVELVTTGGWRIEMNYYLANVGIDDVFRYGGDRFSVVEGRQTPGTLEG